MTSPTKMHAVRIAKSLKPAELAANQALLSTLALGQSILLPRTDGTLHPLEGDAAVQQLGRVIAGMFEGLSNIRQLHSELRAIGAQHEIVADGVFDTPPADTPRREAGHLPFEALAAAG